MAVNDRTDRYARIIIDEGRKLGITPRGIMIALAVGLVETTDLKVYANSNDPPSLDFPHDAVGHDHMSVGVFQQQPPWGPLADRMTVAGSARLFFTVDNGPGVRGLTKIRDSNGNLYDYNSPAHSPGFYAQKVQGSAYPDRYDQRFGDAAALYNRLAGTVTPVIPRRNADFWWNIALPRDRKPYGYGGGWARDNVNVTTDCSGLASNCLEALVRGPDGFDWDREPYSTESWRALDYGQVGPFGTICVRTPADIPSDAAVGIGLHHGGGGPNSHMGCTVFDPDFGQINVESSGDYGQRIGGPARGLYLPDGKTYWTYWNDWAYLPGPIEALNWTPILASFTGEDNPMATADDVARQLDNPDNTIVMYEGADWPNGSWRTGSLRDWVNRLAWDLLRVQPGLDANKNGDGKSARSTLRDGVTRLVFENTLWTSLPTLADLISRRDRRETTHGHARDAAGYGDAAVKILGRIAAKLDIDISDLLD